MKTFRRSKQSKDAWMDRVARMNAGRERKRLERMVGEQPRVEWRGRHEFTVTFQNRMTGEIHVLDLFRGGRRDQFDADVDGKPWRAGISATELSRLLRKKFTPHVVRE